MAEQPGPGSGRPARASLETLASSVVPAQPDPWVVRAVLAFFGLFAWPIRALGVDPSHVHLLLQLRLRLRFRQRRQGGSHALNNMGFLLTCVLMLLFGVLVGLGMLLAEQAYWRIVIGLSFTMIVVTLNSVSDFGEIMADRSEADLVLPAPVEDRAVLLARIAQLSTTMSLLVLSLGLGPLVVGGRGLDGVPWAPLYGIGLVLATMLSAFLVVLVYMVALRAVGPARFKGVLAWIQIGMLTAVYVGFYIVRPLLEDRDLGLADLGGPGTLGHLVWPPCWFAALVEVHAGARDPGLLFQAGAGFVIPPLLLFVALRLARSGYLQALAHRAGSAETATSAPPVSLLLRFGRLICHGPRQLAGFALVVTLMAREPGIRVRIVPSLVLLPVIGISALMRGEVPSGWHLGLAPYLLIPLFVTVQMGARFGETPDGRQLFAPTPASSERELRIGAIKAIAGLSVVLPGLLMLLGLAWSSGSEAVLHGLIAWMLSLAAALALGQAFVDQVPFSEAAPARRSAEGSFAGLVPLLVAGALIGVHLLAAEHAVALAVWGLAGLVACVHQRFRLERLPPARRAHAPAP